MKVNQAILSKLLVVTLLIFPLTAVTEENSVTYEQLLTAALDSSPLVQELELRSVTSHAQAQALAQIANPELSAEVRPYVSGGSNLDQEYEVGISQPLQLGNFGAKSRVALLLQSAATQTRQIELLDLSQSLLLSYAKAWAVQEKVLLTREALVRAKRFSKSVSDANKNGLLSESGMLLFVADEQRLAAEVEGLVGDRNRAIAELTRRSGTSIAGTSIGGRLQELPRSPHSKDLGFNINGNADLENLPAVARIRLLARIAKEQEQLARLDSFPNFAPRVTFEHTDSGADRLNLGFTIALPFFDRNQPERMRAGAERAARDAAVRYSRDGGLESEIRSLSSSLLASEKQTAIYATQIIPTLRKAVSASERELGAGQGDALQVWQIVNQLSIAQDRYLELYVRAIADRAALSILMGKEL